MPTYDMSSQSTGSTFPSDAETLSMALDSSQATPHGQNDGRLSNFSASDPTVPPDSQASLSFNPMDTAGSSIPSQMPTPMSAVVHYVINSEGVISEER